MAPLCSDPRQIVITLNPARRQALFKLVDEIISYMISQLETNQDDLGPVSPSTPSPGVKSSSASYENMAESQLVLAEAQRKHEERQRSLGPNRSSKQAERIQKAAIKHISEWKREFMPRLEEIIKVEDDTKIQEARKKRRDEMDKKKLDTPEEGENLISFGDVKIVKSEDVATLQLLYHAIPTRLTTIPSEDRKEIVSCVLLLLLSTGKYSAHTRALILYLASALDISQAFIIQEEIEIAKLLLESSTANESEKQAMNAEAEAAKRQEENKFNRFWKVGLASVAGAAVIGITGGLAAPLVAGAVGGLMGSVGLGGVASFLGIFWMNGALVGAMFGAYGGKMTGEMMDQYAKEVEDFRFIPLKEEWGKEYAKEDKEAQQARRLRVTIGINGWLSSEDDVTKPWRVIGDDTEVFALRYELKQLLHLGHALRELVESYAWKTLKAEILRRTVLATLMAALWPLHIIAAASSIDNPFGRAYNRSRKAGQLLADALINKVQGERPVTLVGYSLGATAIHACLQSLAERHAFGLIDTVVMIGSPAPSDTAHWRTLRTVVSGKIFNVYSENDMVLGFVYRAHSLEMGVAGLQAIKDIEGIENLDLSELVSGHLRYPGLTGEILRKCGFIDVQAGAEIEKDDFIKLKDEQKEGNILNMDGQAADESRKDSRSPSQKEIADDLRGLTISPPELVAPTKPPRPDPQTPKSPEPEQPSLPVRPAATEPEAVPALPRRPTEPVEQSPPLPKRPTSPAKEENPPLPRRPTEVEQEVLPPLPRRPTEDAKANMSARPRPGTPDTNDEDDREFGGIVMVSYDSDTD